MELGRFTNTPGGAQDTEFPLSSRRLSTDKLKNEFGAMNVMLLYESSMVFQGAALTKMPGTMLVIRLNPAPRYCNCVRLPNVPGSMYVRLLLRILMVVRSG